MFGTVVAFVLAFSAVWAVFLTETEQIRDFTYEGWNDLSVPSKVEWATWSVILPSYIIMISNNDFWFVNYTCAVVLGLSLGDFSTYLHMSRIEERDHGEL